ncbi:MAG: diadenylate cyclase, partial [Gemmatimonadetes bacterium]|nr:diadenylate cyclase [Gemmatimonadota bacterium]
MTWLTDLLQRPPITFWDFVDILIVSVVVYEVLKLIRGTHAVQMGMGIALLVGVFYASRGLQLETVNWLIRNVVGYVVFAAIVLMQGDIRRALVHIGRAPFFRLFRRLDRSVSDDETIEELVSAATALAGKPTGALIVIERSIGLRNYIESGIPLDARLTYDLLVSIFQPTSPLHDGAVIVQNDRVAAAACFLPLTI